MQAIDPEGFAAEWGPRTAERRSPYYNFTCDSPSTWNAPSWPFETCKLLAGLANLLNDYPPQVPRLHGGHLCDPLLASTERTGP